jgi:TRAP-type C4-dicarboxylate transport system permease small subunit
VSAKQTDEGRLPPPSSVRPSSDPAPPGHLLPRGEKDRAQRANATMKSLLHLSDRIVRMAAVALLLSLLVAVLLGVLSRQLNAPLAWTDELAQYLLVWTGFVGWIIAARRRSHIRITVFAEKLPAGAGRVLEIVTQAAIIVFAAVLIRYSFALIERNWDVESIALPISGAALYIVMPLAGLALILQALAEIGDVVAGRRHVAAEPGSQPL